MCEKHTMYGKQHIQEGVRGVWRFPHLWQSGKGDLLDGRRFPSHWKARSCCLRKENNRSLSGSCCLRKEKQIVPGPFALFFLLSFRFRWVFSDISKKTSVALCPQGLTFATSGRRLFLVNSCYRRKGPWNWVWLSSSSPPSLWERIITALCVGCVSPENDSSCFPGMRIKYTFIYTLLEKPGRPPGQSRLRQANIWAFCLRNKVRHGYAKKWLTEWILRGPAPMGLLY